MNFMATNFGVDQTAIFFDIASYDRYIFFMNFSILELCGQVLVGRFGFCNYDQSRGVLVEPVNDSRSLNTSDSRQVFTMV